MATYSLPNFILFANMMLDLSRYCSFTRNQFQRFCLVILDNFMVILVELYPIRILYRLQQFYHAYKRACNQGQIFLMTGGATRFFCFVVIYTYFSRNVLLYIYFLQYESQRLVIAQRLSCSLATLRTWVQTPCTSFFLQFLPFYTKVIAKVLRRDSSPAPTQAHKTNELITAIVNRL